MFLIAAVFQDHRVHCITVELAVLLV